MPGSRGLSRGLETGVSLEKWVPLLPTVVEEMDGDTAERRPALEIHYGMARPMYTCEHHLNLIFWRQFPSGDCKVKTFTRQPPPELTSSYPLHVASFFRWLKPGIDIYNDVLPDPSVGDWKRYIRFLRFAAAENLESSKTKRVSRDPNHMPSLSGFQPKSRWPRHRLLTGLPPPSAPTTRISCEAEVGDLIAAFKALSLDEKPQFSILVIS